MKPHIFKKNGVWMCKIGKLMAVEKTPASALKSALAIELSMKLHKLSSKKDVQLAAGLMNVINMEAMRG